MARSVRIDGDSLRVVLTGITAAAALKRELRVPLAAIQSISTKPREGSGIRVGGTAIPFTDYRQGRFLIDGRRYFISYEDRSKTLTLDLDRAQAGLPYDGLVIGVDDLASMARALHNAMRKWHSSGKGNDVSSSRVCE